MSVFEHRDAMAEHVGTPSVLKHEAGPVTAAPRVTIAIPTFRRAELLMETVNSALAQNGTVPFEVIVVDNDPDEAANAATIARLPPDPPVPLRYFVNSANIGMFPNWNRGIELARGEWVSVLNDDDLLLPDFLSRTLELIGRNPQIDGIVAQTGFLDRRPAAPTARQASLARKAWRALLARRFDRHGLRRIHPRALFFGNELSSSLAFLFRRQVAMDLGGFRPEDWPSADYLLYARFAAAHGLYLLRDELGLVGIGENESMRPEAMIGFMVQGDRLRRSMAGRDVPASWLRMSPLIVSTAVAETEAAWGTPLDRPAIERELGMTLPPPSRARLSLLRLLHRGF